MFKNFNRKNEKIQSIRKQINLNVTSKPQLKKEKYEPNRSLNSQENSYINKSRKKNSKIMDYKEKKQNNNKDKLLFQRTSEFQSKNLNLNSETKIYVNKTNGKKEPKTRIELLHNQLGENLDSFDYSNQGESTPKIVDYFDNARKISAEEDLKKIIPNIQISLNKQKGKQTLKGNLKDFNQNNTQRLFTKSALTNNKSKEEIIECKSVNLNDNTDEASNIEDKSIPKQLFLGKTLPNSNTYKTKKKPKKSIKKQQNFPKYKIKKGKKELTQTNDNLEPKNRFKNENISETNKNDIIKTITNKIKEGYMKNLIHGNEQTK